MEYVTDFTALAGLIGKVVEVSFVFNRDSDEQPYYTIQEAVAKGLGSPDDLTRRYRGRLGVEYGGTDPEPEYTLHWLEVYDDGRLRNDRRLTDFNIPDEKKLIAAQMVVIG